MEIRKYKKSDCKEMIELFYDTVHFINAKDYTTQQLNVWATKNINQVEWNKSFLEHYTIVAVESNIIVGFGDIDNTGYIDRLFTHKDYQGQGIATLICDKLEQFANTETIVTHSSITAKTFFRNRGYKIVKEQKVNINDVILTNYIMEKRIR